MVKERPIFFLMRLQSRPRRGFGSGFTLIEILIVMLIVTMLMAIAIPRIRMVTREQSLREGARIVGSLIGKARDEAMLNGTAGVVLRRNTNFEFDNSWFACTEIGALRAVPDYVGDQIYLKGATPSRGAFKFSGSKIDIPYPIEQQDNPPVTVGDSISINHSSSRFEILEVEPTQSSDGAPVLRLKVDVNGTYPSLPPSFEDVPFLIRRRPRLRRSSTQQLGGRRIIDLRYSGFDPVFESTVKEGGYEFSNYDIEILFNKSGHIGKLLYWELNGSNQRTGALVTRTTGLPIYLLVTDTPASNSMSPFSRLAFWVTIHFQPSSPAIGYSEILQRDPLLDGLPGATASQAIKARGIANDEAHH